MTWRNLPCEGKIRHFPLEQRSKIEDSLGNHHSRNPGRARLSLWLPDSFGRSRFGRLSHSSADLPLPPSSSSCSWATGFSKIREIQEGQGEKQQPPESSPRVDVSGFTTRQAGKTRTELTQQAANSSTPAAQPEPPPARAPSPRPRSGQSQPRRKQGARRGGRATSGQSLSGLFCLPNSSAVSETDADPALNPRNPVQR